MICQVIVSQKLFEGKREYLDFKGSAGEQCSQIGAEQECIGTGDVDIKLL